MGGIRAEVADRQGVSQRGSDLDAGLIGGLDDGQVGFEYLKLGEVVIGPGHPHTQDDAGQGIDAEGAALATDGVLAIAVTGGGRFGEGVISRPQIGKLISPVAGGLNGLVHRSQIIVAVQGDLDAADTGFAGILDAVIIGVQVDKAGQACGRQLAEIVVAALGSLIQHQVGELVVAGLAALRADAVLALQVIGGLGLGEGIGSRP